MRSPSPPGAERTGGSSIHVGALVPLTRPGWVEAGRHLLAGLELAVRDVNDAGGIVGRPLELLVRDTAADPRKAAAAVDELARLGVAALAGEYHSVVARAAAARADALGLPFLCSSAVLDALTEHPTQWVARLAPAQSYGWPLYADFLLRAGRSRIATADPRLESRQQVLLAEPARHVPVRLLAIGDTHRRRIVGQRLVRIVLGDASQQHGFGDERGVVEPRRADGSGPRQHG